MALVKPGSDKETSCQCRRHNRQVSSQDWEDTLEIEVATHSSILIWRIPGTEEPGRLQSIGLKKVGYN